MNISSVKTLDLREGRMGGCHTRLLLSFNSRESNWFWIQIVEIEFLHFLDVLWSAESKK